MKVIHGIMDQFETKMTTSNILRSLTYISWSSDFVKYLEDNWMEGMLYLG